MKSKVIFYINAMTLFFILFKKVPKIFKFFFLVFSNKIIFKPNKYILCENNQPHRITETLMSSDNVLIDACLYNNYKKPSYTDHTIFLYSHGNSGDIHMITKSKTAKYLSKYGSIFFYDYRGYGKSTGKPSDNGLFLDSQTVWSFLINVKNVQPQNIILFGHSLGTSVAVHLMLNILKTNNYCKQLPRAIILQNPFFSIHRLIDEHALLVLKI